MMTVSDSLEAWIEHAERCLRGLALDLRRVPLVESTLRMHIRALELKHAVGRWREEQPDAFARSALVEFIEVLTGEARGYRAQPARSGSGATSARESVFAAHGYSPESKVRAL